MSPKISIKLFSSHFCIFLFDCYSTKIYHPSRNILKLEGPITRDTAWEVETSSWIMYSCGPLHTGRAKAWRPARTYKQQRYADTSVSEDLLEAMDDREGWRERVRDIHADSATWWRWWWFQECFQSILPDGIPRYLSISKRFQMQSLFLRSFLFNLRYFFSPFFHLHLLAGVHFRYSQVHVIFLFSKSSDAF